MVFGRVRGRVRWGAGVSALALTGSLGVAPPVGAVPSASVQSASAAYRPLSSDFNGDGYKDLVIGYPGATVNGHNGAGHVTVLYGSYGGVSTTKRQNFNQDSSGVPGGAEAYDSFGNATAAGDFNGDGYADLAVASYQESTSAGHLAGSVTVFFGSGAGLAHPVAFLEPAVAGTGATSARPWGPPTSTMTAMPN